MPEPTTNDHSAVLHIEPLEVRLHESSLRGAQRRREYVGRSAGIAADWFHRKLRRSASTITSEVTISVDDTHSDHFIMNAQDFVVYCRVVAGGQRFGLPEKLITQPGVSEVHVPLRPQEGE